MHKKLSGTYLCVKGKVLFTLYGTSGKKRATLSASQLQRLFLPPGVAHKVTNLSAEESVIINFPRPAYDPSVPDERIELTEDECEKRIRQS